MVDWDIIIVGVLSGFAGSIIGALITSLIAPRLNWKFKKIRENYDKILKYIKQQNNEYENFDCEKTMEMRFFLMKRAKHIFEKENSLYLEYVSKNIWEPLFFYQNYIEQLPEEEVNDIKLDEIISNLNMYTNIIHHLIKDELNINRYRNRFRLPRNFKYPTSI